MATRKTLDVSLKQIDSQVFEVANPRSDDKGKLAQAMKLRKLAREDNSGAKVTQRDKRVFVLLKGADIKKLEANGVIPRRTRESTGPRESLSELLEKAKKS